MLEYIALNERGVNCLRGGFENFFSLKSVVYAKQSVVYTSKAITVEFKRV